jgi:lipoprotein-anchoring transpeptidase ErfK/SrfK
MIRFARPDQRPLLAFRRPDRRPTRYALVILSLALCLCAFLSAGAVAPSFTSSALAASATSTASSACLSPDEQDDGDHPFTQAELAHPYSLGLRLRGDDSDDAVSACVIHREIPTPLVAAPMRAGQVILVSRRQQWLWAYQDSRLVFVTPVTTGQPDLPTPVGIYHVMLKRANTTFYSPWPKSSPYYYAPLHINYALLFRAGGFYIHDAPWRYEFGPGTNLTLQLPDGSSQTGSHGCVNVPTSAGAWLYQWARVGTLVAIVDGGEPHDATPVEHNAA